MDSDGDGWSGAANGGAVGAAARTDASGGVCVDAVDVAELCGEGLRARLGVIARAESRLAGMKAATLGEIT